MKQLCMLCLVALVGASACAPNSGPIQISKFFPGNLCAIPLETDPYIYSGDLDVVGGAEFWMGATVVLTQSSTGTSGELAVNGTVLEPATRDAPILDTVYVTYSSKPKLQGFKDFSYPIRVNFNADGLAALSAFNIIGPEAADALGAVQQDSTLELFASVEFRGFMKRQGNRVTTGPNVFPIHVHRSTVACGSYRKGFSCSYPGQEAKTSLYCCDGAGGCGVFGSPGCSTTPGCF
jgi:hypothetical protein